MIIFVHFYFPFSVHCYIIIYIYTGLICDGRPNYTDINRALSEVVEENSILCTDKHRSYIPFAAQHNFELHQIRGGRKTVDIYNI